QAAVVAGENGTYSGSSMRAPRGLSPATAGQKRQVSGPFREGDRPLVQARTGRSDSCLVDSEKNNSPEPLRLTEGSRRERPGGARDGGDSGFSSRPFRSPEG
ncbi:unnamed protein product, partial [Discosporangium mesarthrocarpum]